MAAFDNPLAAMKSLLGTAEVPGTADNPKILQWVANLIAAAPTQSGYWGQYRHDSTPWCGLAAAEAMRLSGRPWPYSKGDDEHSALWAKSWLDIGTPVNIADAKPGDVVILTRDGGGHVSILDHWSDGKLMLTGGNQSDTVNTQAFNTANVIGVRRVAPAAAPIIVPSDDEDRFQACVAVVLKVEGGNDDDPNDPGGRTSRGILQREWDEYIIGKPTLPKDVWQAPQKDIIAIYRADYWQKHLCGQMPPGVDLAVMDARVLSGAGIRIVQQVVDVEDDGEVGPITLAAIKREDPATLIRAIKDARLNYLRGLGGWSNYGKGWTNRVNEVTEAALAMVKAAPPVPTPTPTPNLRDIYATTSALAERIRKLEVTVEALQAGANQETPVKPGGLDNIMSILRVLLSRMGDIERVAGNVANGAQTKVTLPTPTVPDSANVTPADQLNKTGLGTSVFVVLGSILLALGGVTPEMTTASGAAIPLAGTAAGVLAAFGKLSPILRAVLAVL